MMTKAVEGIGGALGRRTILLVEDELLLAMQMQELLEVAGFEVLDSTPTGEEAVSLAQKLEPDLVVMDIRLAGRMDGVAAAAEIWERFGIRSLLVTGNTDIARSPRAAAANVAGIVAKPYRDTDVITALAAAFDSTDARDGSRHLCSA